VLAVVLVDGEEEHAELGAIQTPRVRGVELRPADVLRRVRGNASVDVSEPYNPQVESLRSIVEAGRLAATVESGLRPVEPHADGRLGRPGGRTGIRSSIHDPRSRAPS